MNSYGKSCSITIFQKDFLCLLGFGYLFGFVLSGFADSYFLHEAAQNTHFSFQGEVCLQKAKALFSCNYLRGDSLDPSWCSSPLSFRMRKWVLGGPSFSHLLNMMTSTVSEGSGWSYGPGGCEVDGVCGQEAASSTNEPGGVVENSRPVRCC